ncbi:MAG TPA: hypothetical protein VF884_00085 [Nitrososphaeraceae archaeon]
MSLHSRMPVSTNAVVILDDKITGMTGTFVVGYWAFRSRIV